jgi:hypothetical protein
MPEERSSGSKISPTNHRSPKEKYFQSSEREVESKRIQARG